MARRNIPVVDALAEVRRALRVLRRVERSLLWQRRSEAKQGARRSEDQSLINMARIGRGG